MDPSLTQVWAVEGSVLSAAVDTAETNDTEPDEGLSAENEGETRIIRITGSLNNRAGPIARALGSVSNPAAIRKKALDAKADESVGRVALMIDSPGGKVTGIPLAADAISALADEKPVSAYVNGMAASGAYWLAAQADEIVAGPATMVGSIGAVQKIRSVKDRLDDEGVNVEIVRSAPMKAKPQASEQIDDESVKVIQQRVNSIHSKFVDAVASGREMDREEASDLADGKIHLGEKAQEIGLVDRISSPEEFISDLESSEYQTQNEVSAEMKDPKYSKGDKVKWSWQGSTVHGKVNDVGEQFTIDGNKITGEEDEPVYKIDEYDDGSFNDGNVAKPESLLTSSDKDMSTENDETDTSADLEARVDSLTDTVETLTEAVTEMAGQSDGSAEADASTDAVEAKVQTLIERHSDRVAPGEEEQILEIARSAGIDQAEAFIQRLEPVVDDGAPGTEAEETRTAAYDEMQKFPEDDYIGRNDDGEMIATNEEDAKVFEMLNLNYEDATA
ncbi:head maturation protease [Salinibacter phage SRUTV-1]|uniref:Periplasmic serine protease n=1 Tax=Salinibacter phage SRUTV-1 TaxID=2684227 RepID=A0A2D3FAF3_9CAUD|nr:head maturation protease [Salinibacter phage SRUTV-1]ATU47001.1 periplasmic serine protease [Salinibacter phage SRUTV-1]